METQLEDFSRTRAIYELGVSQAQLSMPELLWKAYVDFETEEGEREKARALYERLLKLSGCGARCGVVIAGADSLPRR